MYTITDNAIFVYILLACSARRFFSCLVRVLINFLCVLFFSLSLFRFLPPPLLLRHLHPHFRAYIDNRPVNERLRLDTNVNKAFSPELDSLMAYYTQTKSPPKSSHGKASFSAQIQDGQHYIGSNIQMGLMLEPGNIETHLRCHFQLTLGCPFV